MEIINWKGIAESLLFAAGDEGLSLKQIAHVLEVEELQAREIMDSLIEDYSNSSRGIMVVELAGTFQLVTKKEFSAYLKKLVESPSSASLSQAALETLAIIAYRQPITRTEIEEIRGVKTERPLQTLSAKVLIKEVGRAEGTGRAYLYGTTKEFLDYFGLKSIEELPPLPDKVSEEEDSFQEEADLFFEKFQELDS
ncbi:MULTISPECIES: SMC-Scp complex subunit ScpB [Cytobacillus]|jgi:segregation and condensation protein B|uniref:Segregation and condensation protein B n=2 Tax=Cytobacillus TaxID=2675230 RepID=A0ABX3CTP1_9BACI|nr:MULTISPECIES: SMC-Scp complex subunit ScpB [Cytobacillus]MBY0154647.1 SMC-Scp complex subunit ScpB [Cytobacillus firmus]MBU8731436.1 SMC-Scp complex subunit ScpB [Cytobacillus oceanisediminis]MCM3243657.1 SMC-Scp complex subunit ScpB [Cytobacillus oceanisediminis]MCM3393866.1 SMC-Scp complex subunit ScpB [Cytobacillus oceanisediminis]MCM3405036.1 SMC-Scp complex subunit ScpB [Cytobacillus oceanisediminis]